MFVLLTQSLNKLIILRVEVKETVKKQRKYGFQPGNKLGKGRPKGVPNKLTHDAKAEILKVFDALQKDPKTSLKAVAKTKPDWFYSTIYRAVVPRELNAAVNHELGTNMMELAVPVFHDLHK